MSHKHNLKAKDIVHLFIDKTCIDVPTTRQTELLGISRSSVYYQPRLVDDDTLSIMNQIDRIYTDCPFYGSRRIAKELSRRRDEPTNRKKVQRLMRIMGIEAIYPKPNLSANSSPHPVYPYLLRGLIISYPNHVWGTDITYIRLKNGFVYLVVFLDWFSRFVLAWQLSTTLDAQFCIEAAQEAISNYGIPGIENSDQGTQFTSQEYLDIWEANNVAISMDGRGRAMDNIFTERLWRSLKYENVYLHGYETVSEAYQGINNYFNFYNNQRIHQSLDYQTPAEVYFNKIHQQKTI